MTQRWIGLSVVLLSVNLTGCGGSGGGSGDSSGGRIAFEANPKTVAAGESAFLSWTGPSDATCQAGGGWSGSKPQTGSFKTPPLTESTSYTLKCSGASGASVAELTVAVSGVASNSSAEVTLRTQAGSVPMNGATVLEWNAVAKSCTASGGWSGKKAPKGTERVSGITADTTFTLTCETEKGKALAMIDVMIQRATLRWSGSAKTPPAAFRVSWGKNAAAPENHVTISDPKRREQVIDLPSGGTYYFLLAALDSKQKEIARSNVVSKVLPI